MTDGQRLIRPDTPIGSVEFYMPDVSWKKYKLSTKESFLVIVDQALKLDARGVEIGIDSDAKGTIGLILDEKTIIILNISDGIFDRYWEFLNDAIKSTNGLKIKIKGQDRIYELAGELRSGRNGRKIILRFSKPFKESDLFNIEEPEK